MSSGIVILDYDPAWPGSYTREAELIEQALDGRYVALEHIGSTAVPGLAAKPIIDIMAGLESLADATACIAPLERIGYEFHPEITARLGMNDDRLFVKRSQGQVAAHLHLAAYGGSFWREKLLFRNFLRGHPDTAAQYAALKRTLAPRFSDGPSYSTAKTEFVQSVLQQARAAV
ncbi:MAG TPA: GrpB family protein [Dehalococcoidia bacterium]